MIAEKQRNARSPIPSSLLACILPLVLMSCVLSPPENGSESTPLDPETSRALHRGRIVFQQHCTKCHDSDGGGRPFMKGSNLRRVAGKLSPEGTRQTLLQGQGEMPSFAGVLNDQQLEGVIQYLLMDLLKE